MLIYQGSLKIIITFVSAIYANLDHVQTLNYNI